MEEKTTEQEKKEPVFSGLRFKKKLKYFLFIL